MIRYLHTSTPNVQRKKLGFPITQPRGVSKPHSLLSNRLWYLLPDHHPKRDTLTAWGYGQSNIPSYQICFHLFGGLRGRVWMVRGFGGIYGRNSTRIWIWMLDGYWHLRELPSYPPTPHKGSLLCCGDPPTVTPPHQNFGFGNLTIQGCVPDRFGSSVE